MSTFLVTGAAGFIGSHLVDALLADGHLVTGLDDLSTGKTENLDPRCRLLRGDVADPEIVARAMAGADGCFHLAAVASVQRANEDWLGTHRANGTGTVAVLDAARAAGRLPVVYASSAAVYGTLSEVAEETAQPGPQTAYGADKLAGELHARVGALVHGVPTASLRFFNVYGPRQDPHSPYSGVISIFARRIADGAGVVVHGDGEQTRDFVFVADVVRHLRAAMDVLQRGRADAHVLNVCTGRETSVLTLVRTLGELSGREVAVSYTPSRAGDIARSVGSPRRAVETLGVKAETRLREGLEALLATL